MNNIPEKSSFTTCSIFFKHPDLLNEASDSVMRVDSIYRIDQFDNDTAVLNIIENGSSMRAALSNIEDFMPVSLCEYLIGSPDADVKSYLQVRPGQMIRANGKWEVLETVCVMFE